MTTKLLTSVVGGLLTFGLLASPASARGTDVIRRGRCTSSSTWKLKAGPDAGRLQVEFEVDSNRAGQTWFVQLFDNGQQIFSGNKTTQAPSGSFTLRQFTANRAGSDRIVGRAVNRATNEACQGALSV